jgi:hypothetical protein
MPTEHSDATQSPDDFDRQLRDLYATPPGTARFKEPSAAERARRAARRRRLRVNVRKASTAKKPRRPISAGRDEHGPGRRRVISVAKGAGILVGFVALLLVMHLLGLGPQ